MIHNSVHRSEPDYGEGPRTSKEERIARCADVSACLVAIRDWTRRTADRRSACFVHSLDSVKETVQSAFNQRAAASALSSGRVLNAMAAPGAALCTAFITASNIDRLSKRMPAPITTQS
jgi:hypothetical protein